MSLRLQPVALPVRRHAFGASGRPGGRDLELARESGLAASSEDGAGEMSLSPLVSVVLPCFEAERFLPEALESLLSQTHGDLEIIAIDDGSRDATPGILEKSAATDERVRILRNGTNLGLIRTLNRGVAEARGEFIARMDADDISAPHRIERQVEALALRAEIGVVATGFEPINEVGHAVGRPVRPRSLEPGAARFMALFATPLVHPTLLARSSVMQTHPYGAFDDSLHTEDYELFTRMLAAGVGFLNLDEPLVAYRVGSESVSRRHETIQVDNFVACARRHLERTLASARSLAPTGCLSIGSIEP